MIITCERCGLLNFTVIETDRAFGGMVCAACLAMARLRFALQNSIVPGQCVNEINIPVTLHTGFLWILETPGQLARLYEPAAPDRGPARSKIVTGTLVPRPIDATAYRVAPRKD